MPYREVTVLEVQEVMRLWVAGVGKKPIARQLQLDPKTVRRYVKVAEACGLRPAEGLAGLTEERVTAVLQRLAGPNLDRARGEAWARCQEHRAFLADLVRQRVRLTKVRKLLRRRHGVTVPYSTLHRFAVAALGFGRTAPTLPVAEGEPGDELQLDTGWVTRLGPDPRGRHRRVRAWIFTPARSRYRFVYPCFQETTASAIEACEAAWEFFGGVFRTLIPDNTKAIVQTADPLEPLITPAFLEYAQARGFHLDVARVRRPRDKARTERAVRDVRDDCFGGEEFADLEACRLHAQTWCANEYGLRRHTRTQRLPREHFEADERPALLPAPTTPYDVPLWAEPKVARDQHAQVARALYSLPRRWVGQRLRARADSQTVRFYHGMLLVKVHPRQPPGARSTDPSDFPAHQRAYALRDTAFLREQAEQIGPAVGQMAAALLDAPLPWTRMRRVYALLGLGQKFGAARLNDACTTALALGMLDVRRLGRMLALAVPAPEELPARVIPLARYLRPASQYAVPRPPDPPHPQETA
jgi:hypothetical protein